MIIEFSNFIAGGYIDKDVCKNLIQYFENCKYKTDGHVGRTNERKVRHDIKKSTDLEISLINQDKDILNYYKELNKVLEMYKNKYKYCHEQMTKWSITQPWNIQRYKANEGFYEWHAEIVDRYYSHRHLVFMTYLNNVDNGGETEFYYQKVKIKPEIGLTIMWPPNWSFTHRGIPSKTETKYICTGWYNFN
jgi:hypothetical protein